MVTFHPRLNIRFFSFDVPAVSYQPPLLTGQCFKRDSVQAHGRPQAERKEVFETARHIHQPLERPWRFGFKSDLGLAPGRDSFPGRREPQIGVHDNLYPAPKTEKAKVDDGWGL